jgi:SAM-dependent MidA family methyltransferase
MDGREYLPWSQAMERALYGPGGFYSAGDGPAAHFRTSVHASALFAAAIAGLLRQVDAALGRPPELTLVDMGAGRGELLAAVHEAIADEPFSGRTRLIAVDVATRPAELPAPIEWVDLPPAEVTGLLVANEWLDNVPCDVAELTADGWRSVEVAADGAQRLGPPPDDDELAWLDEWWPTTVRGARAEIGLSRDIAWRDAVATLTRGVAVAIDYAHTKRTRPPHGSLTGYARGRQTEPVPDGSCDITAHVALDSCAAAAAADWTVNTTQRAALHSLGISGTRPPIAMAGADPRGYLRALSQASMAAELTESQGLGGFGWLAQGVDAVAHRLFTRNR